MIMNLSRLMGILLASLSMAVAQHNCENAADPDNGVGNFCSCSDGCWYEGWNGNCDPVGRKAPSCPPPGSNGRRSPAIEVQHCPAYACDEDEDCMELECGPCSPAAKRCYPN
ncbi:hypothetical protein BB8028_0002g04590 [Beauveria bassiana]|uniref:Secreted protein n=1 Tax=Beauveria bassiana TaxID=176275 RepID=A0A2S7Y1U4_BEABA|nr:hypothetical protein BB8028_0002g04590 [Beauveria bassiana]